MTATSYFILIYHTLYSKILRALGFVIRISSTNLTTNSILSFASVVWNPRYRIYIVHIESIQKRSVNYLSRRFHLPAYIYEQCCRVVGLVPLWKRQSIQDGVFLFKILNSMVDSPELLHSIMFLVPSQSSPSCVLLHQSVLTHSRILLLIE